MEFDDFDIIQANHHAAFGKPDRVRNSIQPSHDRVKAPSFPPIATRDYKPKEAKPWPLVIRIIATQKTQEDKGVGDTVKRVLAKMGGEAFEWVMSKAGVNCGCGDRKDWLNRHYRYPRVILPAQPWIDGHEETINEPQSDKLVITIAMGAYGRLLDLSRPLMQAYAAKCGADYVELTNDTQPWWGLEKFRVRHFQKHYKRILFVDCDVLIRSNALDLFRIVPEDSVGIHDDLSSVLSNVRTMNWAYREREQLFGSQGVKLNTQLQKTLNTGVVMCSSHHDIWQPMRKPFPGKHCDEQFWIEQQIERYPVFDLDRRFNTQWWFREFRSIKKDAWFVHFANAPDRERLMGEELAGW